MKSKINRKEKYIILAISLFLLFNTLTLSIGLAKTIEKKSTFNLDKDDPLGPEGYGAIIPSPNTLSALFVDGTNQGKFTVTDWQANFRAEEIVTYPGEDISLYYPLSLDNFWPESYSNVDAINPWTDVSWLNVSGYNAEAENLSPYSVNAVIDYHVMGGGSLNAPFNYELPMQIDVLVKSPGPKVLKFDWLTDNPAAVVYSNFLVSPSGKQVNYYEETARTQGVDLFNYLIFTAYEVGSYRLIVEATYSNPASLYLEFLNTDITSLPLNTVKFGGNSDGLMTIEPGSTPNWQSNWFKISGNKGDLYRLDLYTDYETGPDIPTIDIWTPCRNGYLLDQAIAVGNHEIYFPDSGAAYVSFTDTTFGDLYRYSLLVTKAENVKYILGQDLTTYSISMDEIKNIWFSLQSESIVRFNYTRWSDPLGFPDIDALGDTNAFVFTNSKELEGYDINYAFMTRTVDSTLFYWHYMPAGTYKATIRNTDTSKEGIFQISSKVFEWSDDAIPVNSLTYPMQNPQNFVTVEFEPDDEFYSLKNPVGIDIDITDIGQFRLNTTMWATDNSDTATIFPSYLYIQNATDGNYYSSDYPRSAFSTDGDTNGDYLYIGAPTRWTGMTFDFSVLGSGGTIATPEIYELSGPNWDSFPMDNEGTSGLTADGTIEFDISNVLFGSWDIGADVDLDPSLDESNYYWMRLPCTSDYTTVPVIQQLTLLNGTIRGDLQFVLIGESGYKYDDYWGPTGIFQPGDLADLEASLDDDVGGAYNYDSRESVIIRNSEPYTNGFEGPYKLLIVPEQWDYNGSVRVQFAVEDFWTYRHQETYDISIVSPAPNLHASDINNFTASGYANGNGTIYDYGLSTQYNHTETSLPLGGDQSYFALECFGSPYQWTQLVVAMKGVNDYELYLLQDLPWIDQIGPNREVEPIANNVATNRTFEFGVFSDHFTLLFKVTDDAEIISFNISLSQYNTILLVTSDLRASYTPPLDPALVITLAILIPSATGAVIVVYILKKKGRILTKTPRSK